MLLWSNSELFVWQHNGLKISIVSNQQLVFKTQVSHAFVLLNQFACKNYLSNSVAMINDCVFFAYTIYWLFLICLVFQSSSLHPAFSSTEVESTPKLWIRHTENDSPYVHTWQAKWISLWELAKWEFQLVIYCDRIFFILCLYFELSVWNFNKSGLEIQKRVQNTVNLC